MPHWRHIYAKASDMEKDIICTYPQSDNALPHLKCVLRCCADCPCINIPDKEIDKNRNEPYPQLGFTFITPLDVVLLMVEFHWKTKKYHMCKQKYSSDKSTKTYTRKELVMTETKTYYFHASFSITSIQKLAFHLSHVRILGTNQYNAV